jgi:hypothetical protein
MMGYSGAPLYGRARVALMIAFALLLSLPPAGVPRTAHAAGTSLTVAPARKAVNPGEHFQLDVVINTETPTRGLQLALNYDPSVVQLDRVQVGSFYQSWASSNGAQASIAIPFRPNNTNGQTTLGGLAILGGPPLAGPTGSGPVLSLELTARDGINGRSPIAFAQGAVSGMINGHAQTIDGVVAAGGLVFVGPPDDSVTPPQPIILPDQARLPEFVPAPIVPAPGNAGVAAAPTATPIPPPPLVPTPNLNPVVEAPTTSAPTVQTAATAPPPTAVAAAVTALPTPLPAAPANAPTPESTLETRALATAVPTASADSELSQPTPTPSSASAGGELLPLLAALATQQAGGPTVVPPTPLVATPVTAAGAAPTPAPLAPTPQRVAPSSPVARPVASTAVAKPRGGSGLFIPYELLAGIGGGVVSAGIILYAFRRRVGGAGQ